MAAEAPGAPSNPVKQSADTSQITVSWSSSGIYTGGTDIIDYELWWNQGSVVNDWALSHTITASGSSYSQQVTISTSGIAYKFKVRARNAIDYGAFTNEVEIYAATIPATPAAPTKVSASQTQVTFSWNAPDNGGNAITSYTIKWDQGLGGVLSELATNVVATTYTITDTDNGVVAGTNYLFSVIAINDVGSSGESSASQPIMAATVPDIVQSVAVLSQSQTSISIQWSAPASNGGSPITAYNIYWDGGSGTYVSTALATVDDLITQFTKSDGLTTGITYKFKVLAQNAVGESATHTDLDVIAATVPGQVQSL